MASEDAETMDPLFWGTEEEIERTYAAVLTMRHCRLNNALFVAYVKKWLQDGKGLMASKSVSVVIASSQCSLIPHGIVVVIAE